MAQEPGKNQTGPGGDVSSMEQGLNNIATDFAEFCRIQDSSRHWIVLTAVVIIIVFLMFGYKTYTQVQANFEREVVQQEFTTQFTQVADQASRDLKQVAVEVWPIYREKAVARFNEAAPKLHQKMLASSQTFSTGVQADLEKEIRMMLDRTAKRANKVIGAEFPSLTDTNKLESLTKGLEEQIIKENEDLSVHMSLVYEKELKKIEKVIAKFDVPEKKASVDLEQQFIHLLLQLADMEVMETGDAPAAK